MYQNPFAIKPGEKFTTQQLFDRYLVWHEYRLSNKSWEKREGCDPDLWYGNLCCEDHFRYEDEESVFTRHFIHLDAMCHSDRDYLNTLIKGFIRRHGLKYDPSRLALNMSMSLEKCFVFMAEA